MMSLQRVSDSFAPLLYVHICVFAEAMAGNLPTMMAAATAAAAATAMTMAMATQR